MASAPSLLGLVNQLQNMEMCFTSILMEGAMKLSALTDAKIFMLVETPEGRRFCGRRHLCDAYIGGVLTPEVSDVEMDVDTDVSAVRERHVFNGDPVPVIEITEVTTLTPTTQSPDSQQRRPPRNRKRKCSIPGGVAKRAKENAVAETTNATVKVEDNFAKDDDDVVVEGVNGHVQDEKLSLRTSDKLGQTVPEISTEKVTALKMVSPEEALTKGSFGFKLLNSVLYDLGKRIAHVCCHNGFIDSKDPRAKAEFSCLFDSWVNENLLHLVEHGHKIFDGNQNRSALGFMKYITRTNFNSTMKGFVSVKRLA